ncbi:MAG: hypothetical protein ACRDJH_18170 [Thermomicrobiales bacterium]
MAHHENTHKHFPKSERHSAVRFNSQSNPPPLRLSPPSYRLAAFRLAVLAALVPSAAVAHERWFVEDEGPAPPEWGDFFSLPVLLALLGAVVALAILAVLQRRLGDPLWPRPPFFQRLEPCAPAILAVQTAITMIYAATQLDLFVPNIDLPRNAGGVLVAGITIVAAFSFITGVLTRLGALVIIGLVVLGLAFASWYEVLEQILFVGIALYLVAVGRGVIRMDEGQEEDRFAFMDRLLPHALVILRISAGISVVTLAFTEKLINVDLGIAFLQEYPRFNVAQELGIDWFTDRRFVYAAGIVECVAGIALLAGYLPRLVILVLWIPFNLGIPFLPPQELIGHLPILATMYVILVRGTEGVPAPETHVTDPQPPQHPASRAATPNREGARP